MLVVDHVLTAKYKKFCEPSGLLYPLFAVEHVSVLHDPHEFRKTFQHYVDAQRMARGRMTEEVLARHPCDVCGRAYHEHSTSSRLYLRVAKDTTTEEAGEVLHKIKEHMATDRIAGVTFLFGDALFKGVTQMAAGTAGG